MLRRTCGWTLLLAVCCGAVGCASMSRAMGRKHAAKSPRCANGQCQDGACCNDPDGPLSGPHDANHEPVDSLDVLEGLPPAAVGAAAAKPKGERPPLVPDQKQNPPSPAGIDMPVDQKLPTTEPRFDDALPPAEDEDLSLPVREARLPPTGDRQARPAPARRTGHDAGAIHWEVVNTGPMPEDQPVERRVPTANDEGSNAVTDDASKGANEPAAIDRGDSLRIVRAGASKLRSGDRSTVARYNLLEKGNPLRARASPERIAVTIPPVEAASPAELETSIEPEPPVAPSRYQGRFAPVRKVAEANYEQAYEPSADAPRPAARTARYAEEPARVEMTVYDSEPTDASIEPEPAPMARPARRIAAKPARSSSPVRPFIRPKVTPMERPATEPDDFEQLEPVDQPIDGTSANAPDDELHDPAQRVPPAPPRMRIIGPDFQELKPRSGGYR